MQENDVRLLTGLGVMAAAGALVVPLVTNGFELPSGHGGWVFEFQGLIGALLGSGAAILAALMALRAVRRQIAAGRESSDRQIQEMRRQFRAQIEMATLRQRIAIDREVAPALRHLARLSQRLAKVLPTIHDNRPSVSQFRRMVGIAKTLQTWWSSASAVKELLNDVQTRTVETTLRLLSNYATAEPEDVTDLPDIEDWHLLKIDIDETREIIASVQQIVERMVPGETESSFHDTAPGSG